VAEPGDLIGPYRLLARLGKGAMGDVWRARDERLDRHVALKLLPPDVAGDPERRARMLREARAAAGVGHANVVTLYDVVSEGGTDVLVMELVDGQTLSERLRKDGPPPVRDAIAWLRGIAGALAAAHAKGILHRDVKSANVMVTRDRAVKVLDFGLAKLRDGGPAAASGEAPHLPDHSDGLETVDDRRSAVPDVAMRSTAPRAAVTVDDDAAEVALDATMPSEPPGAASGSGSAGSDQYQTRAGALLGTPMYMAPEQIAGEPPDERSEVFSVGVIAYELCAGRAPYRARAMDELFAQIAHEPPPPLPDRVPAPLAAVVARALAKDPAERYPSMTALDDALAAVARELFAPRRWPYAVAVVVVAAAAAALALWLGGDRRPPERPGDAYVRQALHEYDVFYGAKALSSLRAALRTAPDHPRANAYMILFGGTDDDRAAAAAAAERAVATADGKDEVLLETAIALERRGPRAARAAITAHGVPTDRELAFWAAEMAFRAGDYDAAGREYDRLLGAPARELRGRIYDHDSAVLLYQDRGDDALRIGRMYRDAFPGEADAIGVYATTLAAAGHLDEALAAARDARGLAEGEDTLAGLGKIYALSGDLAKATALYRESMARAGDARRPIRRAAVGLLLWMQGDVAGARDTVAPCLPGGADAEIRERGACLFVAGVVDPAHAEDAARALDQLASAATPLHPAYGQPEALARLVRARARFFGGACVIAVPPPAAPDAEAAAAVERASRAPLDFYAAYHVPFFRTWQACEDAALLAAQGHRDRAAAALAPHLRPYRWWLTDDAARYGAK